jgi:two-component system, sensor histidine kinase RpfC
MTLLTSVRARLAPRFAPEHSQALVRLIVGALVLAFSGLFGSSADVNLVVAGYLVAALGIVVAIYVWPAANAWRRFVGMILDVSGITLFVWFSGAKGVMMVGVYLWVIFGNGVRYGRGALALCQALCILGFCAALIAVPYWQAHIVEGVGLLIMLVVIPLYISTLLQRIQEAHAKTEQALRECLERERRVV